MKLRSLRASSGFTLAELLIVVAIIAVLVAIAIPVFGTALEKSRAATCMANRDSAARECTYALLSSSDSTAAGRLGIINSVMAEYPGSSMCPDGGTYTAREETDGRVTVECSIHTESSAPAGWVSGTGYSVGDTITSGGYIFICKKAHTSGNGQYICDPTTTSSNKTSWACIGAVDGEPLSYDSRLRYEEGMEVNYKGKTYQRTDYNPISSPIPYAGSEYWTLIS